MTANELMNIKNRVDMMLAQMCESSSAFVDFLHRPTDSDWNEATGELRDFEGIEFFCGASKGVIVDCDSDYVVKLPFLFERDCYDWNEEKCDFDRVEYIPAADYCRIEWRNYALANDYNVAECFAATYYLGKFEDCPIYIQERFDCNEEEVDSGAYNSAWKSFKEEHGYSEDMDAETKGELEEEFNDEYYDYEVSWEDLSYDTWGHKLARRFWAFCDECTINDLHNGNVSYYDGNLVVVDFSGYGTSAENAFSDDEWCKNVLTA